MDKCIKIFNQYVKKYNLKDPMIMFKFHHTYRVMEICKELALSLELNEKDTFLATLSGLLHDIARFDQWEKYNTFLDRKSIDHGDQGCTILLEDDFIKQFVTNEDDISIILNTVKYHNKYELPFLDERTSLFCNIVRDADKLDIMREQCNCIKQQQIVLKEDLLSELYNEKMCKNELVENEVDAIVRILSWIFDLNFKYSYNFLLEEHVLENKINLLEIYGKTEETEKLREFIFRKTKEMLIC